MKDIATLDQSLAQAAKLTRLLREAGLPDDAYQWPVNHRNIRKLLVEYWNSLDPSRQKEKVQNHSPVVKPEPWLKPKPIIEQIAVVAEEFRLGRLEAMLWVKKDLPRQSLPEGCYWAAYPSRRAHRYFTSIIRSHAAFTREVLQALGRKVTLDLDWDEKAMLTDDNFTIDARTDLALDLVEESQHGDIWVLPCQLGWNNIGESVKEVRSNFRHPEFGLPMWMTGVQLLVHHEQITDDIRPFINCPGDCVRSAGGDFSSAPIFYFEDDQVKSSAHWFDRAYVYYGSASAFLPQPNLDLLKS